MVLVTQGVALKFQIILDGQQYKINPQSVDPGSTKELSEIWEQFAVDCALGQFLWKRLETIDCGAIVLGRESLRRAVYRSFK
jgi:hypothetical protein